VISALAGRPAEHLKVRRQESGDLEAVTVVSAAAFGLDINDDGHRRRWEERVTHVLGTDPAGCFVAEREGRVVGVAQALIRERLWVLSVLAVDPGGQSAGTGRALMDRALGYAPPGAPGLIISSNDPRALRLYASGGFALRPTFQAVGQVDRRALPAGAARVIDDGDADFEMLAEISRSVRGAPHTAELAYALRRGSRLLQLPGAGFAVAEPTRGLWLLVARDEDAAEALLWSALAVVADLPSVSVRWLDARQQWALRVVLRAGLAVSANGAICTRGETAPLYPYIPSAPFA
jgi:GNAT superfamily N-acetyltransferase